MSLEVRPMEKGDLEALAALEALCFSEHMIEKLKMRQCETLGC